MTNKALLAGAGNPTARVAALIAWQEVLLPYFRDLYRQRLLAGRSDDDAVKAAMHLAGETEPQQDARAFLESDAGLDVVLAPSVRGLVGAWTNLCVWVAATYHRDTQTLTFDADLMPQHAPLDPGDARSWERSVERVFHGLLTVDDVKQVFERVKAERAPDAPLPDEAREALGSYGVMARSVI